MADIDAEARQVFAPSRRAFLRALALTAGGSLLAACAAPAAAPTAAPPKPTEAPKPAAPAVPASSPAPAAAPAVASPAAAAASPAAKPGEPKPAAKIDYKAEMDKLHEPARQEGTLALYSSMNLDDAKVVLPEFEKAYPGVKVDHVRATGEQLQQRLLTEAKGGKVLVDVFDTNAAQVWQVAQEGVMEAYPVPAGQDLPPEFRDEKNLWITERVTTVGIAYNTSMVKPDEAPKTFEDLGDPRWKGKLLMEAADQEMFMALIKQKFPSEEQGIAMFRRIGANEPEVHQGHTQAADLLAAGQGAVLMGAYGHHIIALKAKGAPVEFANKEGVLYSLIFGLVKGAPHPNAAKLYLNWTVSPDGQKVLGAAGRAPVRPGVPIATPLMPDGMKWYVAKPEYTAEFKKFDTLWREIFKIRG